MNCSPFCCMSACSNPHAINSCPFRHFDRIWRNPRRCCPLPCNVGNISINSLQRSDKYADGTQTGGFCLTNGKGSAIINQTQDLKKGDRIDEVPYRHDDEHDHGHADVHVHGFWRARFRNAFSHTTRLRPPTCEQRVRLLGSLTLLFFGRRCFLCAPR